MQFIFHDNLINIMHFNSNPFVNFKNYFLNTIFNNQEKRSLMFDNFEIIDNVIWTCLKLSTYLEKN